MIASIVHTYEFWICLVLIPLSFLTAGHAMLNKQDVRAAIGWVGFAFIPAIGPLFYFFFGINRIQRKAVRLRKKRPILESYVSQANFDAPTLPDSTLLANSMAALDPLVYNLVQVPLQGGNKVEPLFDGDQAYPAMCKAVEKAEHSVTLLTYIFDNDPAGKMFVEALAKAVKRGVQVRVLIDALGSRYSRVSIIEELEKHRIHYDLFMKLRVPWKAKFINLRNHRKIMVVDGKIGFTGGMNIRDDHMLALKPDAPTCDLHFQLEGPIVSDLQDTFVKDWAFTTGEILEGERWFPSLSHVGPTFARGIADGPDADFDRLRWVLMGALACARESVRIITPYFLPDQRLIASLNVAAMRGVNVEILLPEHCNIRSAQWATNAMLQQILQRGCKVYSNPEPFNHSKLMVVDESWVLLGSANWDPRSLRLNFEYNVECYDRPLAKQLHAYLGKYIERAHPITIQTLNQRTFPQRLRDSFFRLLSPYM